MLGAGSMIVIGTSQCANRRAGEMERQSAGVVVTRQADAYEAVRYQQEVLFDLFLVKSTWLSKR